MADGSALTDLIQARKQILLLCEKGRFAAAHMYLTGSGLPASQYQSLWAHVARAASGTGNGVISQKIRRSLWHAGSRSQDTTLKEAEQLLEDGDPEAAIFMISTVFGENPENQKAKHILARCLLEQARGSEALKAIDQERVFALDAGYDPKTPQEAMTMIDLLRLTGALTRAEQRNQSAIRKYPDHSHFLTRAARIFEAKRDPLRAIRVWRHISKTVPDQNVEARFKLIQLLRSLSMFHQSNAIAAELLQRSLSYVDRLRLAILTRQDDMKHSIVKLAGNAPNADADFTGNAQRRFTTLLMDEGDLGLVVWLRRQRISISETTKQVLQQTGFDDVGTRALPDTIEEARDIRSPDIFLPLADLLERPAKPDGWPGISPTPGVVLLVNASLGTGGAERQFVELVRALLTQGIDKDSIHCALFSLSTDRGADRFLPILQSLGVKIHDLESPIFAKKKLPDAADMVCSTLPKEMQSDVSSLWHLVDALTPDVLHGWQDRAGLAAGIVGQLLETKRVIFSARNMSPLTRKDLKLMRFKALYKDFFNQPNFKFSVNSAPARTDYSNWLDVDEKQVEVVRNCFDPAQFPKVLPQPKARKSIRLGGLFRFATNKRPLLWLDIMAALQTISDQKIEPVLRGRGPLQAMIEDHAASVGVKNLLVETDKSDPMELFSDLDATLLTSQVEGTPNALIEAQAFGLPVVATNVGGVSDAVQKTGAGGALLLDPYPDIMEAAKEIAQWLPQALLRGQRARRTFVERRFQPGFIAEQVTSFYCGSERIPG